ncbi:MAG: hypothetical protein IT292_07545 [Deltaproteobacteria bacterium]|nr:hypothetical protein [Deltaproteobacteria bacterium]
MLFYQTADITIVHGFVFTLLSILYLQTVKLEKQQNYNFNSLFVLGLLSGLLVVTRPQACVYLLYPLISLLNGVQKENKYLFSLALFNKTFNVTLLYFLAPLFFLSAIQWLCMSIVNGGWGFYSYQGETFDFLSPHIWEILFSPFHSIFY